MGVLESYQGRKIGEKLAKAIIEKARELKGKLVVLESSQRLEKALGLYKKLGFVEDEYLIEGSFFQVQCAANAATRRSGMIFQPRYTFHGIHYTTMKERFTAKP